MQDGAAPEAGRLLRVLLVWDGPLSAEAGGRRRLWLQWVGVNRRDGKRGVSRVVVLVVPQTFLTVNLTVKVFRAFCLWDLPSGEVPGDAKAYK
jgi:hypothetical protein